MTSKTTDYTHSDYIPIHDGDVVIWKTHNYLRHTTNLTIYYQIIDETMNMTNLFPPTHMKKILEIDTNHLTTLMKTLDIHHRNTRSLNFLGTALKVVAGTPDFDDFEQLKFRQTELIESNNRQIIINTKSQEEINKLTETVNSILESAKSKELDSAHLYEVLLTRNRMLTTEIQNLILAITLAKIKVINPVILDDNDLKFITQEHFTNINVVEIMEVATVKVFQNNKYIHFLIKYPEPERVCKKINIYPVSHNGKILHLGTNNIVAECGTDILAVDKCELTTTSTFCMALPNTTCAQQLHSGKLAQCSTQHNHLDPVMEIEEGIVIINEITANIEEKNSNARVINGTFLITFDDEVWINGTHFINYNNTKRKLPAIAASTLLNITGHQEVLSLPFLHKLNIDNLRYIGKLESEITKRPVLICCAAFILLVACYAVLNVRDHHIRKRKRGDFNNIIAALGKTEDGLSLKGGGVNTISRQP